MKQTLHIDGKNIQVAYFIGIGGIGMSALARYFADAGVRVLGYDKTKTALTETLQKEGMDIVYSDTPQHMTEEVDVVVYTPAVPKELQLFKRAQSLGKPIYKRAEVLGKVTRHRKVVAIGGTHGKTTCSALTTYVLRECGIKVGAFVGGIIPQYQTNYLRGESEWVIVEADEYDRSFLHLHPWYCVVNSLDPDHLDIYGTREAMLDSYREFMQKTQRGGTVWMTEEVAQQIGKQRIEILQQQQIKVIVYGSIDRPFGYRKVRFEKEGVQFEWIDGMGKSIDVRLQMPGEHNVRNAVLALNIAQSLGVDAKAAVRAVEGFRGIWRRFEIVYRDSTRVWIDDYAHHPTELRETIRAARSMNPDRPLIAVFQPHLYTRTRDFAEEFAQALSNVDALWLVDIYPAREEPIPGVDTSLIAAHIKNIPVYRVSLEDLVDQLELPPGQYVLLILGAGDVYTVIPKLKEKLIPNV